MKSYYTPLTRTRHHVYLITLSIFIILHYCFSFLLSLSLKVPSSLFYPAFRCSPINHSALMRIPKVRTEKKKVVWKIPQHRLSQLNYEKRSNDGKKKHTEIPCEKLIRAFIWPIIKMDGPEFKRKNIPSVTKKSGFAHERNSKFIRVV